MLGLSGISADFRSCWQAGPRARFAMKCFVIVQPSNCSLAASLGGIDGIVFTAGVGEKPRRSGAPFAGLAPGSGWTWTNRQNLEHRQRISAPGSRVQAYIIKTDEPDDCPPRCCTARNVENCPASLVNLRAGTEARATEDSCAPPRASRGRSNVVTQFAQANHANRPVRPRMQRTHMAENY